MRQSMYSLSCQFAASVWTFAPILHSHTISTDPDFTAALQTSWKSINLPPAGVHLGSLFPWIVWTIWIHFDEKRDSYQGNKRCSWMARGATSGPSPDVSPAATTTIKPHTLCNYLDQHWCGLEEETKSAGLAWIFSDNNGRTLPQGSTV